MNLLLWQINDFRSSKLCPGAAEVKRQQQLVNWRVGELVD
jgi:hypothetical protein